MIPMQTPLLTLAEYHRLAAQGNFTAHERVELIAGHLQSMSPKGTRHRVCCMLLYEFIATFDPAFTAGLDRALLRPHRPARGE
jgi:hypothetical protein